MDSDIIDRVKIDFGTNSKDALKLLEIFESKNKDKTLMWSHYADNHKGFCLGIDSKALFHFSQASTFSVKYHSSNKSSSKTQKAAESPGQFYTTMYVSKVTLSSDEYKNTDKLTLWEWFLHRSYPMSNLSSQLVGSNVRYLVENRRFFLDLSLRNKN